MNRGRGKLQEMDSSTEGIDSTPTVKRGLGGLVWRAGWEKENPYEHEHVDLVLVLMSVSRSRPTPA